MSRAYAGGSVLRCDRAVTGRLVGAAALALSTSACIGSRTVEVRRFRHEALVWGPSGPHATGPVLPTDRLALEASGSIQPVRASGEPRSSRMTGDAVVEGSGRARVAYGLGGSWEMGFDLDVSHRSLAHPIASDVSTRDVDATWLLRGGPELRGLVAGDRALGVGLLGELQLADLPYRRTIDVRGTTWVYDPPGSPEPTAVYAWQAGFDQQQSVIVPYGRAGMFVTGRASADWDLAGGALVQNVPWFYGTYVDTRGCLSSTTDAGPCTGESTDVVPAFAHRAVGTLFGSAAWSDGPFALVAQGAWHPLGPPALVRATPLSIDLALRWTFDTDRVQVSDDVGVPARGFP